MLYSEKELEKRLQSGCALYYFYASDEALVHAAAQKALKYLNRDDPETTVLDGPTPSVEEIVLAAGTISFFGGKRLVLMPLIRPSTYSDKDLQELCDTLADTENAIFVLTSIIEESYGKLRPGKREQKLIASCEKLGYCVQLNRPTGAALQAMARDWAKEAGADFAPGAEAALLARCGEDQFLLKNEVEKLAAPASACVRAAAPPRSAAAKAASVFSGDGMAHWAISLSLARVRATYKMRISSSTASRRPARRTAACGAVSYRPPSPARRRRPRPSAGCSNTGS